MGDKITVMKERNYGIDLLRIVSMMMIVLLHTLGHGGILNASELLSAKYAVLWGLEIAAYCAVNCFALVSGYVGVDSKIKHSNIIQLCFTVMFYTVGISLIFAIAAPGSVGAVDIIKAVFPYGFGVYWYFTAYFCMFFFTPFFNYLINTLEKSQATKLIVGIVAIFSVLPTIFHTDIAGTNSGYSALWLSALYIIGAYIKKYNVGAQTSILKLFSIYMCGVCATWVSKLFIEFVTLKVIGSVKGGSLLIGYCSPTILVSAVAFMLLFSKLKPKIGFCRIIAFFSPLAFSVYLIHENPIVRNKLISGRFAAYTAYNPALMLLAVLGTVVAIWLVCSIIDLLRYYIFKFLNIKSLCIKIERMVKDLIIKIKKSI